MKKRLAEQLLKKAVAFGMAAVMTVASVGTLAAEEVKASEWVFEEDFEGDCDDWRFANTGEIVQSPDDSQNKVLKMNFDNQSWGYALRDIDLKPNTAYVLEVKVRGDNISVYDQYSDGVYVNIWSGTGYPLDYVNDFRTESFEWCTMQIYFYTSSIGSTTIQCGLGDMSGTAYFDDIRIKEYTYTEVDKDKRIIGESENMRLSLKPETVAESQISDEKYQQLLDDLQSAYKAYYDLTGSAPTYGDKVNMIESFQPAYLRYGAIAGNSIILCGSQVSALKNYMDTGAVNFGWLHEIGHDFDNGSEVETGTIYKYGWDFHDEFWANTKMLYVLDNTDVSTTIDGLTANSLEEILPHYKQNYDKWVADFKGTFDDSYHDALTYIFGTIVQDIGWEPFVKTFHQYTAGEIPMPVSRFAKLQRFLYALQQNYNPNGDEVRSHFQNVEYDAVISYYRNLEEEINTDLEANRWIAEEKIISLVGDEKYPEVIQSVIDSEKKHIDYAGSQEEMDDIVESVEAVISPITVSYKDYKGDTVAVREVKPGEEIPADVMPGEREYYTFNGWYMDEDCTVSVSEGSTAIMEKEITVYGDWEINHYTITYELNGGTNSSLNPVEVTAEDDIIVFAAPEREGYLFEGWYRNSDYTKRIYDFEPKDFSSRVLENFTVYAKWTKKPAEPTATVTPEPTATVTPEPTATVTPEPTMTVTPEPTATATPEPTATVTPEPTATVTPEPTVTATPEPTVTAIPEPSVTVTPEPTVTVAPTATTLPNPTVTLAPAKAVTPTVAPEKISLKKAVAAKLSTQYYYGKAVKPKVKITYQGKVLKKDRDYKLSYKNNKKAGTGKIIITGKGNYTGTKTVTFKIVKGYEDYKVTSKAVLYKSASVKSKKITTLSKGKKVKVYVDSEVKDAKKRVWVKVKTGNKTGYVLIKKLKKVK